VTASDYFDLDDPPPREDPEDFGMSGNDDDHEPTFRHIKTTRTTMTAPSAAAVKSIAPPSVPPSRMSLANVSRGRVQQPARVLLYGVEGIGKSTFGADAPKPIFLGAEDGSSHLEVARFPRPETFEDVGAAVRTLRSEAHDFETLVVDTVDWLEPLLWEFMCRRDGEANVDAYGYGKGYQVAIELWRLFISGLERLQAEKKMHVVLLAHTAIRKFANPEGEDFDRYEMKLHTKAGALLREWVDDCLFANYEVLAHKDGKTKRVRGVTTQARLVHTERSAAYDAKNRHELPAELHLGWAEYWVAVQAGAVASPQVLREEVARKAKALGGDIEAKVLAALAEAGDDPRRLAAVNSRCNALLLERQDTTTNTNTNAKES
jgi:hypothetical protein